MPYLNEKVFDWAKSYFHFWKHNKLEMGFFWTSSLFADVVVAKGDTVLVPLAQ